MPSALLTRILKKRMSIIDKINRQYYKCNYCYSQEILTTPMGITLQGLVYFERLMETQ